MPEKLYVKTSTSSWADVRNLFVKTSASSWATVVDAWVKVSPTLWKPFWSALMSPSQQVTLDQYWYGTNSDLIRFQGTNYKWTPTPQTLKYYFRWSVDGAASTFIGPGGSSGTTTSNPSTSTVLPGTSTYVNIDTEDTNWKRGALNSYTFEVRATGASGTIYPSVSSPYEFRSPKAPTLSFTELTSTSVRMTITANSNDDYIASGRYILYTYDSTDGFVYSGGGRGGFAASSQTLTRDLTSLTSGRNYTVYVLPVTGFSGSTPTNYSGYAGIEASLANVKAGSSDPQAFTTVSFTKGTPSSSSQGVLRSTTLNWNHSTNSTRYEILYEGKTNSTDAWTTVQTFSASPYQAAVTTSPIPTQTQTKQWGSPVPSGGFAYYNFMRAKIRASNPDSTITPISDNDAYIEATGTAPGNPTFGTISFPTTTSASVPFTIGSIGSNFLDSSIEYMSRTDSGTYPASWSTQTYNSSTGQGTITLTTVAGTKYWVKIRTRNLDNLYSGEVETNFTQPDPPTLQTGIKRSINTGTTFTNTSTTMYVSTNGYIAYGFNTPGSISIPTTGYVLNIFGPNDLSQTNTGGTTVNATFKNTSSYFVVRWVGRYLGSSTETLEYEARFYWNSDLVEVNCITNNLTSAHYQSDNAVYNNGSATKTWKTNSSSISSWTLETGMGSAGAPTSTDDGYTAITATKPVIKGAGTKRIIPLGITVTSGSTIAYVSTNGFIGLNSDPGTSIGVPGSGRYLNILQADLYQTALFTKATSTTYAIRYQGYRLGSPSQTVDYEILFTFGSTSAQVYIIANNLTTSPSDDVLIVNGTANNTWSGTNASTMNASADTALGTNNNVDDARTQITLTAPAASTTVTSTSYIAPTTTARNTTFSSVDDSFFQISLPFATTFNGTAYNSIYVGTNSYVTFGGGSTAYSGLSSSNPGFDKIMVDAADRGSPGFYFTSTASSWLLRYEGSSGTSGSPIAIIWEIAASSSSPKRIRVSIKQVAGGGTTGVFSSSAAIGGSSSGMGGANTSWFIDSA